MERPKPTRGAEQKNLSFMAVDEALMLVRSGDRVYVGRVGNKSLRLAFEVRRNGADELGANAHCIRVAVRRQTFESVPVPEELKRRLAPYTRPAAD